MKTAYAPWLALAALWVAQGAHAQATTSAHGSITIVDPPQMTKETELVLQPVARGSGAGVQALEARYGVAGAAGDTFNIAVPNSLRLVRAGGTDEVTLTLTPSGTTNGLAGKVGTVGRGQIGVAGAVVAPKDAAGGLYSGEFSVILTLQ